MPSTLAESSGYRATSTHAEVIAYLTGLPRSTTRGCM
jgi:hypothetical protein